MRSYKPSLHSFSTFCSALCCIIKTAKEIEAITVPVKKTEGTDKTTTTDSIFDHPDQHYANFVISALHLAIEKGLILGIAQIPDGLVNTDQKKSFIDHYKSHLKTTKITSFDTFITSLKTDAKTLTNDQIIKFLGNFLAFVEAEVNLYTKDKALEYKLLSTLVVSQITQLILKGYEKIGFATEDQAKVKMNASIAEHRVKYILLSNESELSKSFCHDIITHDLAGFPLELAASTLADSIALGDYAIYNNIHACII
jgi:hypothetical protein